MNSVKWLRTRPLGALAVMAGLILAPELPAQQGTSVAQLLPPDTLLAGWTDDDAAYQAGLEDMALSKIMEEPEVQQFLEKPKEKVAAAIEKLQAQLRSQEGFENIDLSLEELCKGTYGRAFFALTHFAMPDPQAGRVLPDIGLVIGIEGKADAPDWQALIKELIVAAAKNSGVAIEFQPVDREGYTYEQLTGGNADAPPVLMARAGNLQLFSLSHDSIEGVLDRLQGAATEGSLAQAEHYQEGMKHIGIDAAGALRFFMDANSLIRIAAEGIKFGLTMNGESEMVPLVDRIVEKTGLLGLGAITSAGMSEDGVAHARAWVGMDGEPQGLLAAFGVDEPIDLDVLKVIPKDASSFMLFQANLIQVYDFAMDMVQTVDAEAHAAAQQMIQGLGVQIGGAEEPFRLREDLLANIGPQMGFFAPRAANPMLPSFVFMMQAKNPDRLMTSLKNLLQFVGQQAGGELATKETTYKDVAMVQIEVGAEAGMPISPSFAIIDGYLCLSLSVGDLKRHILRSQKSDEDITQNEDFQRFFSKVPKEAHLTSLSYTDLKYTVESTYGTLVMMLPMLTMAADFELPFDLALMPTQETLTKHLFGSVSYSVQQENGALTESWSPIGGEVLSLAAAGAVGAGAFVLAEKGLGPTERMGAEPATPPAPLEESADDQVRYELQNLKAGITIYKLQNNRLPAQLEQLLEPTEDYQQGYLGREDLPVDPWGNPFHYRPSGDTGYALWSSGPNGENEDGQGDDILVEKK